MPGETRYLAYMLRLWVVRRGETLLCRAQLENPHTGSHHAFANLEDLFNYLAQEVSGVGSETCQEGGGDNERARGNS